MNTLTCYKNFILSLLILLFAIQSHAQLITTVAGTYPGNCANGAPARLSPLSGTNGITTDRSGNIYVAEGPNNVVRKIDVSTGIITTIAGNQYGYYSGASGIATSVSLYSPSGLAADSLDNLYIADYQNHVVRKVSLSTGNLTTIAGNSYIGYTGDGGPATSAEIYYPSNVAVDHSGNVFIVDDNYQVIRKVDGTTGIISTYAGNDTSTVRTDGRPANMTRLLGPKGMAVDRNGNLYIAESGNHRIRMVSAATGIITTVAGCDTATISGDGRPATTAYLHYPNDVSIDASGNLYITDNSVNVIRKVTASTGIISTIAGRYTAGYSGDGGLADTATMSSPVCAAVDTNGNIYIGDLGNLRVRKVTAANNIISTIAGTGLTTMGGDGASAKVALLNYPEGITKDGAGNVYIADSHNNVIRKVDALTGIITTIAGTGVQGYSGDSGLATSATLNWPYGLAIDHSDNLYIADYNNHRIRMVAAGTGIITTIAGTGQYGYNGDNIPAYAAQLFYPASLKTDSHGDLYVADSDNHRIRKINLTTGIITTVAGSYILGGYGGDGGPAISAKLNNPFGMDIDQWDNIYIADQFNNRIRKVTAATGIISTIAGCSADTNIVCSGGYCCDSMSAMHAGLWYPKDVAVDRAGNVYIADQSNARLRKIDALTNIITTICGHGQYPEEYDSIPAISSDLAPGCLYIDAAGDLYETDLVYFSKKIGLQCTPSVYITTAQNTLCNAGADTFTAWLSAPNISASYQWYKNGAPVGPNAATYIAPVINNDDSIWVTATMTPSCGPAVTMTSNHVSIFVMPATPSVSIMALHNPIRIYAMDTFIAIPVNGGPAPTYQWYVNGVPKGSNSRYPMGQVYNANNNDSVWVVMHRGLVCSTEDSAISNHIIVAVIPLTADTVWPGDANNDRIVDNTDLLPIGLGYDTTGPSRTSSSIVWQKEPVTAWSQYFTGYNPPVNYDHADCNGDGIIDAQDTVAISQNFSLTHAKTIQPEQSRSGLPALTPVPSVDTLRAGDTLTITFVLGDATIQVSNIYGLAFTYNFDPTLIDSTYTNMEFGNSWLGSSTDKISMIKDLNATGQIKAAVTRIDHTNRSGNGAIATARFKTIANGLNSYHSWNGFISDIHATDMHGAPVNLNAGADTAEINFSPNGIKEVSTASIRMQPNPAHDKILISADNTIREVYVMNIAGQKMMSQTEIGSTAKSVDISSYDSGLYFVTIKTDKETAILKLIKE